MAMPPTRRSRGCRRTGELAEALRGWGKSSDASLRDPVRLTDGNLVTFGQRARKSLYPRRTYTGIIPRLLA